MTRNPFSQMIIFSVLQALDPFPVRFSVGKDLISICFGGSVIMVVDTVVQERSESRSRHPDSWWWVINGGLNKIQTAFSARLSDNSIIIRDGV